MEAAHSSALEHQAPPTGTTPSDKERRCLATGEMLLKEKMLRFVVAPDNSIVPDLAEGLPGRGLWVKADRSALQLAVKKGLFAKAAKASALAAPDLPEQTLRLLRARCLSFVGLAKAAGVAILGEEQVRDALRRDKIAFLLLADDAKGQLDQRGGVPECRLFTRDELGAALGFAQIVYAGFKPHGITKRLRAEINRLTQLTTISPQTTEVTEP